MNQQTTNILNTLDTITLKEMDGVKLMDRTDTKFTFHLNQLPSILAEIAPHYKCLLIDSKKISNYQTLYYDTNDMLLYNKHHNGHLNRYKIRHRTYLDSGLAYLEVKFKNNKGRTIKERIKEKSVTSVFQNATFSFLTSQLPFNANLLKPVVWVNYSRITLVNKQTAERVTIDLNLEFKKDDKQINYNNLVIAEVKQEKKSTSEFLNAMKKFHVREGSISKYCFAIASTYKKIKKNNFKAKLLSLKNISENDIITSKHRSAS